MESWGIRVRGSEIVVAMLFWGSLSCSCAAAQNSKASLCSKDSLSDLALGFRQSTCSPTDSIGSIKYIPVIKGDEVSLQKVLNMVHKNKHQYVAVLFYTSWCPFSRIFRPIFSISSSLYPSIPHFAIEESSVRPSILSKYGVHGFPTLFILNSTMRVRYRGSRTIDSLVGFYNAVTGIRIASLDQPSLQKIGHLLVHEKHGNTNPEGRSFSWARSPENLLRQETTYLALATTFVLLRLLYIIFPMLLIRFQCAWRRVIPNFRLGSLLEHPSVYLKQIMQSLNCSKEPCKRSNLQEGAMNAKSWASKSLATVSIGEASTSWVMHQ